MQDEVLIKLTWYRSTKSLGCMDSYDVLGLGLIAALNVYALRRFFVNTDNVVKRRKKVVCFGASIVSQGFNPNTNGWLCNLSEWWVRRADVVNRGFSGYNSRWGLMIVEEAVLVEHPDFVIIFFGANDAAVDGDAQHVPIAQYIANLVFIMETIKKVQGLICATHCDTLLLTCLWCLSYE